MKNCDFEIVVTVKGRSFRMEVTKIYEGDSLERFRVTGGNRSIVLQSNRPMLNRSGTKKPIDWKMLEGDIMSSNAKDAAEGLDKIIQHIEYNILEKPTPLGFYIDSLKDDEQE